MTFEHVVLSVVKDTARHSKSEFFNGTLFVANISQEDATRILNNLRAMAYADTIMNVSGTEFAFDFI